MRHGNRVIVNLSETLNLSSRWSLPRPRKMWKGRWCFPFVCLFSLDVGGTGTGDHSQPSYQKVEREDMIIRPVARRHSWIGPMGNPIPPIPGQNHYMTRLDRTRLCICYATGGTPIAVTHKKLSCLDYLAAPNPYFLWTGLRIEVFRDKCTSPVYSHHRGVAFHIDHSYPNPITLASFPIETFLTPLTSLPPKSILLN